MDYSYNSSFESEDEAPTETINLEKDTNSTSGFPKPTDPKIDSLENPLDLTTLNEELGYITTLSNNHTSSSGNRKQIAVKTQQADKCISNAQKIGNITAKTNADKNRLAQTATICFKRNAPTHQGSSYFNRRKKLRQIEHDNMIILKKLQKIQPSTQVTAWKKGHTILTAFASKTNKNATNGDKSGK